jgi:hypothetical protein
VNFDDVEFPFDETLRAQFTAEALAAYDAKFERLFRIGVYVFNYLLVKIGPHFAARRLDSRGRRAMRPELIIATGLLYLSTGNTCESVAQSMRNGIMKAVVMRCVWMLNNSMVSEIAPWIITFSKSLASRARNARYFENRSLIPT